MLDLMIVNPLFWLGISCLVGSFVLVFMAGRFTSRAEQDKLKLGKEVRADLHRYQQKADVLVEENLALKAQLEANTAAMSSVAQMKEALDKVTSMFQKSEQALDYVSNLAGSAISQVMGGEAQLRDTRYVPKIIGAYSGGYTARAKIFVTEMVPQN